MEGATKRNSSRAYEWGLRMFLAVGPMHRTVHGHLWIHLKSQDKEKPRNPQKYTHTHPSKAVTPRFVDSADFSIGGGSHQFARCESLLSCFVVNIVEYLRQSSHLLGIEIAN
eukprot:1762714-Amphidinium_carterae.1